MCKITVYMPSYNCEKFIEMAIESVIRQTVSDWELIVINDGSTDQTRNILRQYGQHPKIRILDQENKGLTVTNNIALRLSNGKYIIRLDADDYFDENALLVLSNILDANPDVGMVYPDFFQVNAQGDIIEIVRHDKIDGGEKVLDIPPHGAGTMYRKEVLLQIGGYSEKFSCQDGYDLWLRFIRKYTPYNVNLPLFYYRRHENNMTGNMGKILTTRYQIKRDYIKKEMNGHVPRVLGIIPAAGNSIYPQCQPFVRLGADTLLSYTLEEAIKSECLDKIVLSSEDDKVIEYAAQYQRIQTLKRSSQQNKGLGTILRMETLIREILDELKQKEDYVPDAVCTLYINTPFRRCHHIDKAIHTMTIFNFDSVISVQEELAPCYIHRKQGLKPLCETNRHVRAERDAIYKENGAIYLSRVDVIRQNRLIGGSIGFIMMLPQESIKINSNYDLWLTNQLVKGNSISYPLSAPNG